MRTESELSITPLQWDTEHLGFPVARLSSGEAAPSAIAAALDSAFRQGTRLVYWETASEPAKTDPLLSRYGGALVCRKVTFHQPLQPREAETAAGRDRKVGQEEIKVVKHPKQTASEPLRELAVAAGAHSRFNLDPRIPEGKFRSLYELWIENSTLGRLADVVLTAVDNTGEVAGLVTISQDQREGHIGLFAVSQRLRRRGVGRLLVREAHRWMARRGLVNASVVTQLENTAACAFYRRCGYRPREVKNVYHFWLNEAARTAARPIE